MDNIACFGLPSEPWTVDPEGSFGVTVMSNDGGSLAIITEPKITRGAYEQIWRRETERVAHAIAAIPDAVHYINRAIKAMDAALTALDYESNEWTDLNDALRRLETAREDLRGQTYKKKKKNESN